MERNDELKEIGIENRTCYYLDGMIRFKDFDFNNISIHRKIIRKYFSL